VIEVFSLAGYVVAAILVGVLAVYAGWWLRSRQESSHPVPLPDLPSATDPSAGSSPATPSSSRMLAREPQTFRAGPPGPQIELAREEFQRRREWLEARFFTLAARSGKPRGLAWNDCRFADDFVLARERDQGLLRAFVSVTIRFTAVEGGGMEDNPNVGNLRDATAVFSWNGEEWSTDGRAVFNLSPSQTLERFQLEVME
jgi:hypothetical protein